MVILENLKVGKYKKEGEKFPRLQTTQKSEMCKSEGKVEKLFDNIPIGDVREKGTVLGVSNVYGYFSCGKCKKKVNESEIDKDSVKCSNCQCVGRPFADFVVDLFIELKEDIIVTLKLFKRKIDMKNVQDIDHINSEETENILTEELVGKIISFDADITRDDEQKNYRGHILQICE